MSELPPAHHLPVKHPPKRLWQKIALVIANISFGCAAIGVVVTVVYGGDVAPEYKAAMGAITFFCAAVGVVLKALGGTSIPNLKIEKQENNKEDA
ncbi:hypothetical protein [Colwellia sp. RSH04]|uniref:hypothetical protein n=1 Tax=Colwellia sp. RSH04 TaxID=2305464 RepID=UPI000E57DB94|nr:hypothetical protein [Colwellia sp. RSH04]RHW76371.1 hypothetical protein D1094_08620 [Colwellia sp. RSH04]